MAPVNVDRRYLSRRSQEFAYSPAPHRHEGAPRLPSGRPSTCGLMAIDAHGPAPTPSHLASPPQATPSAISRSATSAAIRRNSPQRTPATRRNNLRMEAPESLRVAFYNSSHRAAEVKPRVTKAISGFPWRKKPQTAHSPSRPRFWASSRKERLGRAHRYGRSPRRPRGSRAGRRSASGAPWVRP